MSRLRCRFWDGLLRFKLATIRASVTVLHLLLMISVSIHIRRTRLKLLLCVVHAANLCVRYGSYDMIPCYI